MKKVIFSLLVAISFLTTAQETVTGTMLHDSTERTHQIYIPSSYTKEKLAPLLLLIHGYSEPSKWILEYTKFKPLADKYGFIIACPEGKINATKVPAWNFYDTNDKGEIKDVTYINSFMDKLINDYSIDKKRIYITGFSQGGYMSFLAGCQLSSRIAAIAPVSGAMPTSSFFKCEPTHTTPALVINGDKDNAVPYHGNENVKSTTQSLKYWVTYNKCNNKPIVTSVLDANTADDQTVEKHQFFNAEKKAIVVHYKIKGGTHLWPGREGNTSLEAAPIIWEFLSQFKLE